MNRIDPADPDRVPMVAPLSRQAIELRAERFLMLNEPAVLEHPQALNVVDLCDRLEDICPGVEFAVADLPPPLEGRFSGGVLTLSSSAYSAALDGDSRARFTCAHELAHVILHHSQLESIRERRSAITLHRRQHIPAYRDPEWQANVFAAAILMPTRMVQLVVADHRLEDLRVARIIHTFGVSKRAAELRLRGMESRVAL